MDPVGDLAHDHAALNRAVVALGARLAERDVTSGDVADELVALREELFHHFAQEEEGLFPFVAEAFPDHADRIDEMARAHDGICGALARACHLAADDADKALVIAMFARFEVAYATHAKLEGGLLEELGPKLSLAQRQRLADLVRDL